jgi:poly-gamma-glutamate synthesis protein (capsule biosynthesis protein)
VKYAGAGLNLREAETPAIMDIEYKGRVIIFSCGMATSGILKNWSATIDGPGVNLLQDFSDKTVEHINENVQKVKRPGDIVVVTIHWGGNWGYRIPSEQIRFAHKLVDDAGVDIIHGHSSHHVKGMEVYRDRPILYGCGDFLNDYEGIRGHEQYRDDLSLMYIVTMDPSTGTLAGLRMIPTQIRHFKVNKAKKTDVLWLRKILNREGEKFGTHVELNEDDSFSLHWD